MGCGKSKQSVAINDSTLRKGESTNTATNNGGEIRFKPFPNKKENPDEITEAEAREVDGENLNAEMRGELDGVDAKALPRPEDAKESREMLLLPREEGVEDEALGQEEEREEEKKDGILEEEKGAAFEEDKDASPEDGLGDRDEENRRLISHDSPDHYFSSRKDDEALEGIPSEYNSPVHVEANKPVRGKLESKEGPAAAAVAEPMIGAADGSQTSAVRST